MPTPPPGPQAQGKRELRERIRRERRSRSPDLRAAHAEALTKVVAASPQLAAARVVALYASTPTEPGTGPLRAALAARGVLVLLPVVTSAGHDAGPLAWYPDRTGRLCASPIGTTTPRAGGDRAGGDRAGGDRAGGDRAGTGAGDGEWADLAGADVVLLPALAVDARGHRLGQGGGHYDRSLAALAAAGHNPHLVALVHDEEVLPAGSFPLEAHDAPVHAAATPTRWLALG